MADVNLSIENILWKRVNRFLPVLQIVPFLKMVSVCNNLAFSTVDEKSDIDLFIVAKTRRLFTVRMFVTALLHVLGVRRHHDKVSGRFCLSFFIDETEMNLEKIALDNDIYLAYWLRSMLPVIESEEGFSDRFLTKNFWISPYFEAFSDASLRKERLINGNFLSSLLRRGFEFVLSGRLGSFIESKLKTWQLRRAHIKAMDAENEASLIISEHMLKFHNVDRRRKYRRIWTDTYGTEKLNDQKFRAMKSMF